MASNLVEPILFQCKFQPSAVAICAPGTLLSVVTYGRLEQIIQAIASRARSHSLVKGNVAALFIKDPILHAAFILGLAKIGVVTVSAIEPELPKQLDVQIVFADASYPGARTSNIIAVDKTWIEAPALTDSNSRAVDFLDEDFCRVALTSGTTGEMKAVALTNKLMAPRILRLQMSCGSWFADCSRIFLDIGLATGLGFTYLIYTLSRGGTLFLRGASLPETLEAISAYRVQALVSSPKSLSELTDLCDRRSVLSRGFEAIISMGSFLTPTLSERIRANLGSNLISKYGTTEVGPIGTAPAHALSKAEGAVGFAVPGVSVDTVSPSNEQLPEGQEGLLRIRSVSLVDGYIGDLEATQLKFPGGAFVPGDIGKVLPNGMIVVSGRDQAIINIGGDKVLPERIENVLTSFKAIQDAAAFPATTPSGGQVLSCAIVWRGEADLPGLQQHLQKSLPPVFVPRSFVAVSLIPRNASGKIDRGQLKETVSRRDKPSND